ncbi:uncharacterized protein TNCV_3971201 [Trichonephila clavipes]|nr:uncharacterized protein TNCV_3971201 [Trichonephila clavipes]
MFWEDNRAARRHPKESRTCSTRFKSGEERWSIHSSDIKTFHYLLNISSVVWPCLVILVTVAEQWSLLTGIGLFSPAGQYIGHPLELFSYGGHRYPVVKVSDHGRYVISSSPVPLKTRRVGVRCTLNLSRAQTFSRWCGVVVRRGGASSGVVLIP